MNKETKLRIHNITAKAALKFGSEAWVMKKTSTFNDRSTGSCICLRLDVYMSHISLLCFYAYRLYLTCDMYKSNLRHIHDPVLLSLKVEVMCFVLSCFPPSLPLFRIPRPHTCIGSESRLSLREGSTAQAEMTSLCYDSCEFQWNKRRLRHIHVKFTWEVLLVGLTKLCLLGFYNFYSCTVHLDTIEYFIYLTDAQLDCSKKNAQFYITIYMRSTSHVYFNVKFSILLEQSSWA